MIKIDNEFYIDSDTYQYILQQKKFNNVKKEEYFSTVAYLGSVDECIREVMKIKQRRVCQKDLNLIGALHEFRKINNEMKNILNGIGKDERL